MQPTVYGRQSGSALDKFRRKLAEETSTARYMAAYQGAQGGTGAPGIGAGSARDVLLSDVSPARGPGVPLEEQDGNRTLAADNGERTHHHIVWMCLAEFLVTLLFATVGTLGSSLSLSFLYQALAQTAVLVFATAIGLAQSGAHINPFVTVLLVLMQKFHLWYGALFALVVHPLAYAAGVGLAVLLSPAPVSAAVPFYLGDLWRVALYEGFGMTVIAIAVAWSLVSPTLLRQFPQTLPNHNSVALVPLSAPVLIGFAYLATAIPGMFISGSIYNFYRYFFSALYAGALDGFVVMAYLLPPLAAVLLVWAGDLLFTMYLQYQHGSTWEEGKAKL